MENTLCLLFSTKLWCTIHATQAPHIMLASSKLLKAAKYIIRMVKYIIYIHHPKIYTHIDSCTTQHTHYEAKQKKSINLPCKQATRLYINAPKQLYIHPWDNRSRNCIIIDWNEDWNVRRDRPLCVIGMKVQRRFIYSVFIPLSAQHRRTILAKPLSVGNTLVL